MREQENVTFPMTARARVLGGDDIIAFGKGRAVPAKRADEDRSAAEKKEEEKRERKVGERMGANERLFLSSATLIGCLFSLLPKNICARGEVGGVDFVCGAAGKWIEQKGARGFFKSTTERERKAAFTRIRTRA